jgi:hypothetical protein
MRCGGSVAGYVPWMSAVALIPSLSQVLLIAVAIAFRNEGQTMGDAVRRIFRVVRNKQQLGRALLDQHVHEAPYQLAVKRIQTLQVAHRGSTAPGV